MSFLLIAGKDEGFTFEQACVCELDGEFDVESRINSLRGEGFRIFKIYKHTVRVDDVIGDVKRYEEGE